ncbi:MAG: oxaloacetate decarboxylase subunit alpha, partial [Stomatobaculum sp.]|nr:oxaloacetate decarboxylase subunit alpha [Stomatobaculum sp.]
KLVKGEFGQCVRPINPEIQKMILKDEEPITCRPADLIEPQLPKYEQEVAPWKMQDEDVLSYALFPQVALEFFKWRQAQKTGMDISKADTGSKAYPC